MVSKRRLQWLAVVSAILVLCGTSAWLLWPPRHRITAETYERLRPGVTRAEAEELLGGPGGSGQDLSDWLNNRSPTMDSGTDMLNDHRPATKYWFQDSGIIIVQFDSEDLVADKQFLRVRVSTSRQRVVRLLERVGW